MMRHVISALSFAVILLLALPASALDPGDVNGDTRLTLDDAMLIKDHLLEMAALDGEELLRADANQDTKVTMADVAYVTTHLYKPEEVTVMLPGDVPLVMVKIPKGSFQMGRYSGERNSYSYEEPQHTVTINYDFYIGKYEVTQQQWLALMGNWPDSLRNPNSDNFGVGDDFPAYFISWNDCQDFIAALNDHISSTSQGPASFRLPSEAEWEYACRAGTQTRFFFGESLLVDDSGNDGAAGTLPGKRSDYMWFNGNSTEGTNPTGAKLASQFGVHDMSGNVWEWCQDYWHNNYTGAPMDGSAWLSSPSSYRVTRGGDWRFDALVCRSAYRNINLSDARGNDVGMRLSRTQ